MRRAPALIAAIVAAAVVTACGGVDEGAPAQPPAATQSAQEKAQEAARKLLEEYEKCDSCTGAERARERIENGLAKQPEGSALLVPETSGP